MVDKRKNMYNTLKEFTDQDDDLDHGLFVEKLIGIEFLYHGVYYRMCVEWPIPEEHLPKKDGVPLRVSTAYGSGPCSCQEHYLNWYIDLYDCLENWIIDGVKFKDVIVDPETLVTGQD